MTVSVTCCEQCEDYLVNQLAAIAPIYQPQVSYNEGLCIVAIPIGSDSLHDGGVLSLAEYGANSLVRQIPHGATEVLGGDFYCRGVF